MIAIESRTDALLWFLVDEVFSGRDSREAVAEFELAYLRLRASECLGSDWLLDLLRETAA